MSEAVGEYLFNTFCDYVVERLPAYLAEIEQTAGDAASLPMFRTVQRGYKDVFSLNAYDGLMFVPSGVQRGDHTVTTQLSLVMAHESKKPELLTVRQMRYADAIQNLIEDDPRLHGQVEHTDVSDVRFFPAAAGTKEVCVTTIAVSVRAHYRRECLPMGG